MSAWIIKKIRFYMKEGKKGTFAVPNFSKSQKEDETITKVIQLKREDVAPTASRKSKESKEVRILLQNMEKLILGDDGVLWRRTTDKQQLLLP